MSSLKSTLIVILAGFTATSLESSERMDVLAVRSLKTAHDRLITVTGTVTFFDRAWATLFIQDKTGGIFINLSAVPGTLGIKYGDRVEVTGRITPSLPTSNIVAQYVRRLGEGVLPEPADLPPRHATDLEAQWVSVTGYAYRYERCDDRFHYLQVAGEYFSFVASVPADAPSDLVEALFSHRARLRGVASLNHNRVDVFIADHELIDLIDSETRLVPAERTTADIRLVRHSLRGTSISARGVVTLIDEAMVVLTDRTGHAFVQPSNAPLLSPGDLIQACGIVRRQGKSVRLVDATIDVLGKANRPRPKAISVADVVDHVGELIVLSGTVVSIEWLDQQQHIFLADVARPAK